MNFDDEFPDESTEIGSDESLQTIFRLPDSANTLVRRHEYGLVEAPPEGNKHGDRRYSTCTATGIAG